MPTTPCAAPQALRHVPAGVGDTYNVIGELLTFKVTTAETNGAFAVVELVAQPGGGPPLHTHPSAESFTILEGAFEFSSLKGGQITTVRAEPGDTVFVPAGMPHAYKAVSETPGKTMLVLTPGDEMERFFAEAGVLVAPGAPGPSGPPIFLPCWRSATSTGWRSCSPTRRAMMRSLEAVRGREQRQGGAVHVHRGHHGDSRDDRGAVPHGAPASG